MFSQDPAMFFFHPGSGSRTQGSKKHRIPDPGSGSALLLSGSCELDAVLRGGIPFGHVTELVGEAS
jgi:hypothetical protein